MTDSIKVEVAYAKPDTQVILQLDVPDGTSLEQAVKSSGILKKFPEIDLSNNKLGIFGKIAKPDTPLRDRDRVEIYRPLIADPKETRRKRAAKKEEKEDSKNKQAPTTDKG